MAGFTFLALSAATIFGISGCQQEISGELPTIVAQPPNPAWVSQTPAASVHPVPQLLKSLKQPDISTTINVSIGGICIGGNCTALIPNNAFVKLDGTPVTGNVTITLTPASKYADMLYNGLGTLTANELLITGGMVRIRATQGSDVLKLKPGKEITTVFQTLSNPDYDAFAGKETGNAANPVQWELNNNWTVLPDSGFTNQVVRINIDSLGWVNCDRVMNLPGAPTNIYVTLPTGFGNANSNVYMVFNSVKSIIGLFGDAANQRFWQGTNYRVPTGENIKLVAVAKKDNKVYYGFSQVTIATNMTVSISQMEEISEAELNTRLNAL